LFAFDALPK
jgi:hypothetical protein